MQSLMLALGLVVPMTVDMAAGWLVRRCGILQQATLKQINELIFRLLIPLSLFFDVYHSDLKATVQPRLFALTLAGILLVYTVCCLLLPRLTGERRDAATVTQAIYRSNYVLFGSTIGASLCGEAGAAVTAALAVMVVPLFNALAVILFESARGGAADPGRLALRIFQNPMVIAGIVGILFNLGGVPLPALLAAPLEALGDIASPLALVVLGGLLSVRSMAGHKGLLAGAVLCRLVVVPLVFLPLFIALGYHGPELVAVLAVFASPAAISSTPMAQSMGGNGALAGEIVAVSSVGCILTLFCFVMALGQMGLL